MKRVKKPRRPDAPKTLVVIQWPDGILTQMSESTACFLRDQSNQQIRVYRYELVEHMKGDSRG